MPPGAKELLPWAKQSFGGVYVYVHVHAYMHCVRMCVRRHLPVTQGQFHKALAVAQGDYILARHGAKGFGCAPNHDDDGIATPILRKQVVYGVPVYGTDALGVRGGTQSGPLTEALPYPLTTVTYKNKEPWTWAPHLTQPLRSCIALSKLFFF